MRFIMEKGAERKVVELSINDTAGQEEITRMMKTCVQCRGRTVWRACARRQPTVQAVTLLLRRS